MRTQFDKSLRPWGKGLTDHDYDLSSIVLFQTAETDDSQVAEDTDSDSGSIDINAALPYNVTSENAIPVDSISGDKVAEISLDGSNPYYGLFNNFGLTGVSESSEEITKLHVNFSEHWNLFFFGSSPKIYVFTGFFIDSKEYPYYQEFMSAYNQFLRGRKCIENEMEMIVAYQGKVVPGYLLGVSVQSGAQQQLIKQFSFRVLVREEVWVRNNLVGKRSADGRVTFSQTNDTNYMSNKHRFPKTQASPLTLNTLDQSSSLGVNNE